MKKIPVFTSILLIVGVLATMAFSHPLVVRNGPVTSYSAGSTLTIQNHGVEETYFLRQGTSMLPQNSNGSLAPGARVTIVAQCFHYGAVDHSASASSEQANQHPCVALAVIVRRAASGAVPATGGNGTTATGTTTPGATSVPNAGATATPCICPTATGTATLAPGATMTPTATPAAGTGTATATPTSPSACTCPPAATPTP